MKNSELIEKLRQLPQDLEVCIFDDDSSEDPQAIIGLYEDFEVHVVNTEEELQQHKDDNPGLDVVNWIALSFSSRDHVFRD